MIPAVARRVEQTKGCSGALTTWSESHDDSRLVGQRLLILPAGNWMLRMNHSSLGEGAQRIREPPISPDIARRAGTRYLAFSDSAGCTPACRCVIIRQFGSRPNSEVLLRLLLAIAVVSAAFTQTRLPPAAERKIDFESDVQPLLSQKCYACHGQEVQQSGLRLDKRQNALRGGDYGPVINPGNSATSKLILRLVNGDGGLQMPPTGALSDEEIGMLRAWIDQGAEFKIQVEAEAPAKPVDPKLAALITAVRSGDTQAAGKSIAASPELVNAHDRAGATPLHHAAGFGDLATMKLLLEHGADANAGNRRKSTPLSWS